VHQRIKKGFLTKAILDLWDQITVTGTLYRNKLELYVARKYHVIAAVSNIGVTGMWADAQRDGRPAGYRWHPLFNAAKFA